MKVKAFSECLPMANLHNSISRCSGVPGFRRKAAVAKLFIITKVAALFPFYCMIYMLMPYCHTAKIIRKPFMKFLIHASSYLFFLCNSIIAN